MNLKASALAGGILWGLALFVLTLMEAARGYGHALSKLSLVFPGYSVTYAGSIVGLIYGFVSGAIVLGIFCWLYNALGGAAAK
jgi:hypothetical protein